MRLDGGGTSVFEMLESPVRMTEVIVRLLEWPSISKRREYSELCVIVA